jgi:hypothetical protein
MKGKVVGKMTRRKTKMKLSALGQHFKWASALILKNLEIFRKVLFEKDGRDNLEENMHPPVFETVKQALHEYFITEDHDGNSVAFPGLVLVDHRKGQIDNTAGLVHSIAVSNDDYRLKR